jgi:hypothetical protein
MAPIQEYALKPIEDAAEQVALDERMKRWEETTSPDPASNSARKKSTVPLILELCRQLSAKARLQIVTELCEVLSLKQQIAIVESLTAQLPVEVVRQMEDQLHERLEGADAAVIRRKEGA